LRLDDIDGEVLAQHRHVDRLAERAGQLISQWSGLLGQFELDVDTASESYDPESQPVFSALGILLDQGLDAVFDRHIRLGRACREGAKAMGLELFSPDEDRSAVVTAIRAPEGIDATELVRGLRDRFGITIANGQSTLKGKIFRIGHIGYFDVFDITTALAAVELVLADLGAEVERGVAVTRALEAYEERARV